MASVFTRCINLFNGMASKCFPGSKCLRLMVTLMAIWISIVYMFFSDEVMRTVPYFSHGARLFKGIPQECTFPNTDPFSPVKSGIVKWYPPLDCSANTPNIVYREDFALHINHTKVKAAGMDISYCRYKEVMRDKENDKKFEYSWFSQNFTDSIKLKEWNENVVSECFNSSGHVISRSYFPLIRVRARTELALVKPLKDHIHKNSPQETLNIFIIGIDGLSKQSFERAMPKSRNFLLQQMGAIELHKYNKLAFETFPNVLALLTGHTPEEFYRDWHYNRTEYVDQINEAFLWTDATKIGYRTAMILDAHSITAFHYQKKGFKVSPVDYYQRPTVLSSTSDKLMRGNDSNCIGDTPEVTIVHDYWLQMASTFGKNKTTPFFAYSFAVRVTHDDPDLAYIADDAYHKFLQDLVATKGLDNTVIIWFSDHGPRFGPIRSSYQGRIETNTPIMFFVFPPWFERKYPELIETLKINQHRLTSHFDMYETIKDILYMKPGQKTKGTLKERGISLFREVPRERSCKDAGIPGEYCSCGSFSTARLDKRSIEDIAQALLDKVNSYVGFKTDAISSKNNTSFTSAHLSTKELKFTSEHSGQDFRHKCSKLSLENVESLYEVSIIQLRDLKAKSYRVSIYTTPGHGLFEGLINYEPDGLAHVEGEVVRLNLYRGQADCIQDPFTMQFCYCLNNLF